MTRQVYLASVVLKRKKDAKYKDNLIYTPTEEEKAAMDPDHYFYGLYFVLLEN